MINSPKVPTKQQATALKNMTLGKYVPPITIPLLFLKTDLKLDCLALFSLILTERNCSGSYKAFCCRR